MSLKTIETTDGGAVWCCGTDGFVLGPLFDSADQAFAFERFVTSRTGRDPREIYWRRLRYWCENCDQPVHDCGPDGWLCDECREPAEHWELTQDGPRLVG